MDREKLSGFGPVIPQRGFEPTNDGALCHDLRVWISAPFSPELS